MKVRIDFWQVVVSSFYGDCKMPATALAMYYTKEEAEKAFMDFYHDTDYAERDEDSFPGRTFKIKEALGNNIATIERITDVPEEFFFRRIEVSHGWVEKDVPVILDIKDISKIQLFTKDGTVEVHNAEVIDMIDDKVYNTYICDSLLPDCANKTRAVNGLKAMDILTIGNLLQFSPSDVVRFRNVGMKVVEYLQRELKKTYGIDWR